MLNGMDKEVDLVRFWEHSMVTAFPLPSLVGLPLSKVLRWLTVVQLQLLFCQLVFWKELLYWE